MDEEQLRDEIYKRLGIEKGSLSSESGNDWQRAKNEILEELRQKELESQIDDTDVDYLTIEKNHPLFTSLLDSTSYKKQVYKSILAARQDLNDEEMLRLANTGDKEVLISLSKQESLTPALIDILIDKGTYMAKKTLIEMHGTSFSSEQKERLLSLFTQFPETYQESLKSKLLEILH
jgi:hypothetical protein